MKNTIFITCLLGISLVACSNDIPATEVPSIILNAFKADYPNATNVDWEKTKGNYEAEFKINNIEHEVLFSADGKKIMQKKEIAANELPAVISTALQNNFKAYVADEVEQVIKDGATYYQLELETSGKTDKEVVFAADGSQNTSLKYWE